MNADSYRKRVLATGGGIGLALASVVVALVSVLAISLVLQALGLFGTGAAFIVQYTAAQVGFLPLALAYLSFRGRWSSVGVRRPTVRDAGWILLIPVLLAGVSLVLEPLLSVLGLPPAEAPVVETPDVLEQPALLLLVFVWWYLVAAPSEELLFRGVIQGRLRETFGAASGVVLASLIFAIPHVAFVLIDGGGSVTVLTQAIQTFVGGLAFGAAYERTGNLVVPAVGHATMWTMVLFVV